MLDRGLSGGWQLPGPDFALPSVRRRGTAVPPVITATVLPAMSRLYDGQAIEDATGFATMVAPANFASTDGTIVSAVVAVTGDPETVSEALAEGASAGFTVTVTDDQANERVFNAGPIIVEYDAVVSGIVANLATVDVNTIVPDAVTVPFAVSGHAAAHYNGPYSAPAATLRNDLWAFPGTAVLSYSSLAEGATLTSDDGLWAMPEGTVSLSRVWRRNGVIIPGETGVTYTLTATDIETSIRCDVTGDDGVNTPVTIIGSPVPIPAPASVLSFLAVTQAPNQADILFDYTVDMDGDFSWGIGEAANFPGADPAAEAAAFRAGVGLDDFGGGLTLVTSGGPVNVPLTDDLGPLTGRTLMMLPEGSDAIVFATGAVPFTLDTTTPPPPPAISVEDDDTFTINNNAGNVVVPIIDAAEDDITIILRSPLYYYVSPPPVVTAGYTQILNDEPSGHQTRTTIDYKVQGGTPDADVEIADGGGDASDDQAGVMLNIRGVDPASPFRVAPGTPATATGTDTIVPPAVAGVQAGDLVVCVISYKGDETGTVTPPAGYTAALQADTGEFVGVPHYQAIAVFFKIATGASETPGPATVGITSPYLTAHTFVLGAA